jgi:hypothetical protein
LAIAKIIASRSIAASAVAGKMRAPESPTNKSMPASASAGEPVSCSRLECSAYQRLEGFIAPLT